jgi:hypothetical protein
MTGVIGYQNLAHYANKSSILGQFPRNWGFSVPEKRSWKPSKKVTNQRKLGQVFLLLELHHAVRKNDQQMLQFRFLDYFDSLF